MKAIIDGVIVAEAEQEELVAIEGNWYFPPESIVEGSLTPSPTPYTCPWKGVCQYYTVVLPTGKFPDYAWAYPEPYPSAIERVGRDFSRYVAFGKDVSVVD